MTVISSIKQAAKLESNGKLTYYKVKDSKLKLRIQINGNKDWIIRYSSSVGGKRKQLSAKIAEFKSDQKIEEIKAQALLVLNEKKKLNQRNVDVYQSQIHSFDDVWAEYSVDTYLYNASATQLQKRYSFERYSEFFKSLGKTDVRMITTSDVSKFKSTRSHVQTACNRDLSHMSHYFQFAKLNHYIAVNPVNGVSKFTETKGSDGISLNQLEWFFELLDRYPRKYDTRTNIPLLDEHGRQVYDEHKKTVANFAKFLVLTGLRVSEARFLSFQPIEGTNYITKEHCRLTLRDKFFVTLNSHKSAKRTGQRKVQIINSAVECLRLLPPYSPRRVVANGKWVFPNKRKNGPISRKSIDNFISDLNNSIDIWGHHERITMRSLRHTFARRALSYNLTHDQLANLLGHTSTAMIRKHYASPDQEQISQAVNLLEDKIEAGI